MSAPWPKIGTGTTLSQEVYEAVRRRLTDGGPEPGTFLREADLAQAMGVSRTPVLEALSQLASEGFIERIPHRGFRVPERSMDDLFHLYPVLQALEVLGGELAFPRLTSKDLEELERINDDFAEALREGKVVEAVELNDRFHQCFTDRSGNPVLQELVADLRAQVRRLELWDFTEVLAHRGDGQPVAWVRQHAELIEAVRRGRFDEALKALHDNRTIAYVTARDELERTRAEQSEPGGI